MKPSPFDCSVALFGTVMSAHEFINYKTAFKRSHKSLCELKYFWIPHQKTGKQKTEDKTEENPHKCDLVTPDFMQCLNLSSSEIHEHLMVYYTFHTMYRFKQKRVSWRAASNTCSSLSGDLPVFNSRGEYEEFVEFSGYSEYFPLSEILFVTAHDKVRVVSM